MLRGMGWEEGMGVGRNRKVVSAIEYISRPDRLGLGANPSALAATAAAADKKKVVKMGEQTLLHLLTPPSAALPRYSTQTNSYPPPPPDPSQGTSPPVPARTGSWPRTRTGVSAMCVSWMSS